MDMKENKILNALHDAESKVNPFVIICFLMGVVVIVMFFFPLFNYTNPDEEIGYSYNYSTFDVLQGVIQGDKYADINAYDYEKKRALVDWINDEHSNPYIIASVASGTIGTGLMVLAFASLFFGGPWLELILSALGAVSFSCCFVFNNYLIEELKHIPAYTTMAFSSGWALYVCLFVTAMFFSLNVVRRHVARKRGE